MAPAITNRSFLRAYKAYIVPGYRTLYLKYDDLKDTIENREPGVSLVFLLESKLHAEIKRLDRCVRYIFKEVE
jgi:hypothetical protein